MFNDKVLNCRDCGRDFEFTASEQEFYAEKGFTNEPGRCPECRAAKKAERNQGGGGGYGRQERQMFPDVCATCGKIRWFLFNRLVTTLSMASALYPLHVATGKLLIYIVETFPSISAGRLFCVLYMQNEDHRGMVWALGVCKQNIHLITLVFEFCNRHNPSTARS